VRIWRSALTRNRARGLRAQRLRLAHPRATAIAIDAAGTDVHHAPGQSALPQHGKQIACAPILFAASVRRRQMQHHLRQSSETAQAAPLVQIANDRRDAHRAQRRRARRVAHQRVQIEVAGQQGDGAARDVAAADDEQVFHAAIILHLHTALLASRRNTL